MLHLPMANANATSSGYAQRETHDSVGFEPTQHALVELESTPLNNSGKLSLAENGS
jgi:hypothetical protein